MRNGDKKWPIVIKPGGCSTQLSYRVPGCFNIPAADYLLVKSHSWRLLKIEVRLSRILRDKYWVSVFLFTAWFTRHDVWIAVAPESCNTAELAEEFRTDAMLFLNFISESTSTPQEHDLWSGPERHLKRKNFPFCWNMCASSHNVRCKDACSIYKDDVANRKWR